MHAHSSAGAPMDRNGATRGGALERGAGSSCCSCRAEGWRLAAGGWRLGCKSFLVRFSQGLEACVRPRALQPCLPGRLDKRHASGVCLFSPAVHVPYMNAPRTHSWTPLRTHERAWTRTYTCLSGSVYADTVTSTGGPIVHTHPTFSPGSDVYLFGRGEIEIMCAN